MQQAPLTQATRRGGPRLRLKVDAWITACRIRGALTQTERAVLVGINRSHLSSLESGGRSPSGDFIVTVCIGLDLAVGALFEVVKR